MNKLTSIVAFLALSTVAINALGTDYGVTVNNTATLSFKVAGVAQNNKESNTDTFKVDRKVDLTVATSDTENMVVVPKINVGDGNDKKPLTFTVTNKSNGTQDYILSASNLASGVDTKDNGEVDSVDYGADLKICVDNTCSAGNISGTNISFNEDETKTYYVFADIPDTAVDGERASIALTATAVNDGTTTVMTDDSSSADDQAEVDVVFAEADGDASGDAAKDGKHSALSAYEVATATITVAKDSCVVSDGVSVDTKAKRIPGATIRYTIDVFNNGSADTSDSILTDTLQGDLTYVSGKILDDACNCLNPAGTEVDSVTNSAQAVTVNYGAISAGTHECAYIEATINN